MSEKPRTPEENQQNFDKLPTFLKHEIIKMDKEEADIARELVESGRAKNYDEAVKMAEVEFKAKLVQKKIQREKEQKEIKKGRQERLNRITCPVEKIIPDINLDGLIETETKVTSDIEYKVPIVVNPKLFRENGPGLDKKKLLDIPLLGSSTEFGSALSSNYAAQIKYRYREEDMKGKTLVDLGAGDQDNGYTIAALSGANYVAVEPHNMGWLIKDLAESKEDSEEKIKMALVMDDMLDFLKRIPIGDNLVLLLSGIDEEIIPDRRYLAQVRREIVRLKESKADFIEGSANGPSIWEYK